MAITLKLALAMTLGIGAKGLASGSGGGGGGGGTPAFDRYVSPTGSALNSGSSSSPWSVAKFLSSGGIVAPGIKVGFLGGNYVGQFVGGSAISGSPTLPVLMQQVPGERATIDGNVGVGSIEGPIWRQQASYVWMQDFEIVNTDPIRHSATPGSNPTDMNWRSAKGLRNEGPFNKYINNWIHDTANGGEDQNEGTAWGTEWHGNKINSVGWWASDRGHGHSLYVQNANALGKLLKNNICYGSFDLGVQLSGSAATLLYITTDGLILSDCGYDGVAPNNTGLMVQLNESNDPTKCGNSTHKKGYFWGKNSAPPNFNITGNLPILPISFTDNYVVGGSSFNECQAYDIERNTCVEYLSFGHKCIAIRRPAGQLNSAHTIDNNTHFGRSTEPPFSDFLDPSTPTLLTFAQWQARGYDLHSTCTDAYKPTVSVVFFQPNDYEVQRGHYVCYNWGGTATLPLDLSLAGFHAGDPYKIWHQYSDWYGTPDYSGTYDGSSLVNAAMAGWVPPDFIGMPGAHCNSTAPEFNVFIVRKG